MNNIDILEEFINDYKKVQEKYKDDEIQAEIERSCYFEEVPYQAIETLIVENKELKEKIKEINEEYNAEQKHEMENTISKSKVEELIDKKLGEISVQGEEAEYGACWLANHIKSLLGKE